MLISLRRWLVRVLGPPAEPSKPAHEPRALPAPAVVPRPRPRGEDEGDDRAARRLAEVEARANKAEARARKADEAKARAEAAAKTAEARASEAIDRARRAESALSRETHAREKGTKRRRGKGDALEAKLQRAADELRAAEQRTRQTERQRAEADERTRALEARLEEVEARSKELADRAREAAEELAERRAATVGTPAGEARQRRPAVNVEAHFSPGDECLNAIRSQLDRARATVDVCVFTITDDRIAEALLAAHRRGVHVRIVTDNDKALDEGSDVRRLERAGIEVREDRTEFHMHHKFAVFDSKVLLTGSYNWTRGAARFNEENLIVTDDARLIGPFMREFQALWSKLAPG